LATVDNHHNNNSSEALSELYHQYLSAANADYIYMVVQKTDTHIYFWDNFGNSAPILTILSLLQAEIYGA